MDHPLTHPVTNIVSYDARLRWKRYSCGLYRVRQSHPDRPAEVVGSFERLADAVEMASETSAQADLSAWIDIQGDTVARVYADGAIMGIGL